MKVKFEKLCSAIFVLVFSFVGVFAQTTSVDTSFHAVPSTPLTSNSAVQHLVQPDGKIVIWGAALVADGVAKGEILRLNTDGTLDPTFSYCGCDLGGVSSVVATPSGQFIVAGVNQTGSNSVAKMIRLNSDGSLDSGFVFEPPSNSFGSSAMTVVAIQPDGKVFAYRRQNFTGFAEFTLYRFNAGGSVDTGFTPIQLTSGSPSYATVNGLVFLPDGKFYLAITHGTWGSSGSVRRFNGDGTIDLTWESPNFTSSGFPTSISIGGISLEPDGSLLVAGKWETVNGLQKANLIRLLPAGNVDVNFSPTVTLSATNVESLNDGKILYSLMIDISGIYRLYRVNSDGSPDATFSMDSSVDSVLNKWTRDSSGNIIFLGAIGQSRKYVRLFPNGNADSEFAPNLTVYGSINAIAQQTDGKVIVAGNFSQINGIAKLNFARTDSEGNLDTSFDTGSGFNTVPSALILQNDGKIIAFGNFSTYNGVSRPSIARINSDGSLDTGFTPTVSALSGVAIQADGKIVIAGSFTSVNGTARTRVARLESNGDLDNSFNPTIGNGTVYRTLVQSDGKIVIGGSFSGVNGFNRTNFVRLNSDGNLDQTFVGSSLTVTGLWRQDDGKFVLANSANLVRKNSDGSSDGTFVSIPFTASSSSDSQVNTVLLMADGSMLVGGRFDTVGGVARRNFTRIKSNGELDPLFLPYGADNRVLVVAQAADSKVYLGGEFSKVDQTSQPGISRLSVVALRTVARFDFDGDGKSDVAVFRPSENKWYILRSSDFGVEQPVFAISGDLPVPSDFDGDGKTDLAIFRPSLGDWWYRSSYNGGQAFAHWGNSSDIVMPSDFDGDGRTDYVVFRPSTNVWHRVSSANGVTSNKAFGSAGDKPLIGDFDGDGKSDVAIYRPSSGDWWWQSSIDNVQRATHWGISSDVPVPADYDGDGKTDFAVFRPSTGAWYILNSSTGQPTIVGFGLAEDKPVAADYDGDGKADIAVFRPSTGVWYLLRSTSGFTALQFGISTDVPVPYAFVQ